MKLEQKKNLAQKRQWRVRKNVFGTQDRPRLSVHFSNKHILAQCINDEKGVTLVALGTLEKSLREAHLHANIAGAEKLGHEFAKKAISCGVKEVVFDRGSRRYHGGVKAFADAARQEGLVF